MNQVQKVDVGQALEQYNKDWSEVLPKYITPDRFMKMAISGLRKNPKLVAAMQTPQGMASTIDCITTLAEVGLEYDGRKAHLIPFKNEVTLVIDYKGLVEICMKTGRVANIHADKVCENDIFEYNMGNIDKHKVDFRNDRGKAYAYYCVITMKDGTKKCEVMQYAEIEKVRMGSPGKNSEPWRKWYDEMAKKTVFKRLVKWLDLSPELSKAIEHDDSEYKKEINITNQASIVEVNPLSIINELRESNTEQLQAYCDNYRIDIDNPREAILSSITKRPNDFINAVTNFQIQG